MRHGSSNRRQRNRGGNSRRPTQNRNKVFDSNGPDVRIRGTAHQVAEKYEALAKDATSAGDASMAQNYLQHAEHYLRVISAWDEEAGQVKRNGQDKEEKSATESNNDEDDLSLPVSALGPDVKAGSEVSGELELS